MKYLKIINYELYYIVLFIINYITDKLCTD